MAESHASSPAELKAQLEVERRGTSFLLYRDADGAQRILELDAGGTVTIGRRADNAVPLAWDAEVSRVHAQLERVGRDWVLIDDGLSRNGTFVNGERTAGRRRLRDGDRICCGETVLRFRAPLEQESRSTAAVAVGSGQQLLLTETQRKLLVALCRPLQDSPYATPATNRDIAEELYLSVDAVKAHLRVLFERLGIDGLPQNQKRARLAAVALVDGLVRQHDF